MLFSNNFFSPFLSYEFSISAAQNNVIETIKKQLSEIPADKSKYTPEDTKKIDTFKSSLRSIPPIDQSNVISILIKECPNTKVVLDYIINDNILETKYIPELLPFIDKNKNIKSDMSILKIHPDYILKDTGPFASLAKSNMPLESIKTQLLDKPILLKPEQINQLKPIINNFVKTPQKLETNLSKSNRKPIENIPAIVLSNISEFTDSDLVDILLGVTPERKAAGIFQLGEKASPKQKDFLFKELFPEISSIGVDSKEHTFSAIEIYRFFHPNKRKELLETLKIIPKQKISKDIALQMITLTMKIFPEKTDILLTGMKKLGIDFPIFDRIHKSKALSTIKLPDIKTYEEDNDPLTTSQQTLIYFEKPEERIIGPLFYLHKKDVTDPNFAAMMQVTNLLSQKKDVLGISKPEKITKLPSKARDNIIEKLQLIITNAKGPKEPAAEQAMHLLPKLVETDKLPSVYKSLYKAPKSSDIQSAIFSEYFVACTETKKEPDQNYIDMLKLSPNNAQGRAVITIVYQQHPQLLFLCLDQISDSKIKAFAIEKLKDKKNPVNKVRNLTKTPETLQAQKSFNEVKKNPNKILEEFKNIKSPDMDAVDINEAMKSVEQGISKEKIVGGTALAGGAALAGAAFSKKQQPSSPEGAAEAALPSLNKSRDREEPIETNED